MSEKMPDWYVNEVYFKLSEVHDYKVDQLPFIGSIAEICFKIMNDKIKLKPIESAPHGNKILLLGLDGVFISKTWNENDIDDIEFYIFWCELPQMPK